MFIQSKKKWVLFLGLVCVSVSNSFAENNDEFTSIAEIEGLVKKKCPDCADKKKCKTCNGSGFKYVPGSKKKGDVQVEDLELQNDKKSTEKQNLNEEATTDVSDYQESDSQKSVAGEETQKEETQKVEHVAEKQNLNEEATTNVSDYQESDSQKSVASEETQKEETQKVEHVAEKQNLNGEVTTVVSDYQESDSQKSVASEETQKEETQKVEKSTLKPSFFEKNYKHVKLNFKKLFAYLVFKLEEAKDPVKYYEAGFLKKIWYNFLRACNWVNNKIRRRSEVVGKKGYEELLKELSGKEVSANLKEVGPRFEDELNRIKGHRKAIKDLKEKIASEKNDQEKEKLEEQLKKYEDEQRLTIEALKNYENKLSKDGSKVVNLKYYTDKILNGSFSKKDLDYLKKIYKQVKEYDGKRSLVDLINVGKQDLDSKKRMILDKKREMGKLSKNYEGELKKKVKELGVKATDFGLAKNSEENGFSKEFKAANGDLAKIGEGRKKAEEKMFHLYKKVERLKTMLK